MTILQAMGLAKYWRQQQEEDYARKVARRLLGNRCPTCGLDQNWCGCTYEDHHSKGERA